MPGLWYPDAILAKSNRAGLQFIGVPYKHVLHTIEAPATAAYRYNPANYFGHQSWPHATADRFGIYQHLPIDVGAYALYRDGVATNTANTIQLEIMGQAGSIHELPEATLENIAGWLKWCRDETGAPLTPTPQGFHGADEGITLASEFSPIRYGNDPRWTDQDWLNFSGVVGHQHVGSRNDHWDPGNIWPILAPYLDLEEEFDVATAAEINAKLDTVLSRTQFANDVLARVTAGHGDSPNVYGDAEAFFRRIETTQRRVEEWGAFFNGRLDAILKAIESGRTSDAQAIAKATLRELKAQLPG